jgi:hypothetical protein
MKYLKKSTYKNSAVCLALGIFLSACASKEAINLKIYSEPEGSHVVYMVTRAHSDEPPPWIYLGVTPYKGVTVIDNDALDTDDTISIKVMYNGYLDQKKEWNGEQFLQEFEDKGMIFWTPRLVKSK